MPKVAAYLEKVDSQDKDFVGTVALRSEELTLPDGSKLALGIDGGHWVLVYQKAAGAAFEVFEYDQRGKKIIVDKKPGGGEDIKRFKKLLAYFFSNASVEDLVTLLPPQMVEKT